MSKFFLEKRKLLGGRSSGIVDLHFRDFVGHQLQVMQHFYEQFNFPWTQQVEAAMRDFLEETPKGKHGENKPRLEDYGMNDALIDSYFPEYLEFLETMPRLSFD